MRGKSAKDLSGQRFGRLVVIRRYGTYKTPSGEWPKPVWLCRCDCGTEIAVRGTNLSSGATRSCGCLSREMASARMKEVWRRAHDRP